MLPKAVESTVVERHETKAFKVGVAEMNGFRASMEDAHIIHMKETWGFFGVFDGHGGDQCSAFVEHTLVERFEAGGCPEDDETIREMMFSVDKEFLDTDMGSGSTATMCIVHKPAGGEKHKLRVINAGDSRVLLGRRDGTIVDGGGTDQGLTTDHKPNYPSERERIYRCGGFVEEAEGGCARVNGDLAVSRGFGDREYKKSGGPHPKDHPVTIDPEITHLDCDDADFLMLVCDGVSEGDFSNPEVVKYAAEIMAENDWDPGVACKMVCHRAVDRNSKDNITCMIVMFDGKEVKEKSVEFNPGPITEHNGFITAYKAIAAKANFTLAEAIEKRYDIMPEDEREKLVGDGPEPPPRTSYGEGDERTEWFKRKAAKLDNPQDSPGGDGQNELLRLLGQLNSRPGGTDQLRAILENRGGPGGDPGGGNADPGIL